MWLVRNQDNYKTRFRVDFYDTIYMEEEPYWDQTGKDRMRRSHPKTQLVQRRIVINGPSPHVHIVKYYFLFVKKHSFIGKVNKLKARSIKIKYNLFHDKKYDTFKVIHTTVKISHRLNKEDRGFFFFFLFKSRKFS